LGGHYKLDLQETLNYTDYSVTDKIELFIQAQIHNPSIDDTAGDGILNKSWSANKLFDEFSLKENLANKGVANGYVPLNASTKIDSTYLPAYVDDVIEVADFASLPLTGETGKIYVTLDNNKTYRWSGTVYIEISPALILNANLTDIETGTATDKVITAQSLRLISLIDYNTNENLSFGGLLTNVTGGGNTAFGLYAGDQPTARTLNLTTTIGFTSGGDNTGQQITVVGGLAGNQNTGDSITAIGVNAGLLNTFNNVSLIGYNATADENGQLVHSKDGGIMARFSTSLLTATRKWNLPNANGTLALTSDIGSGSTNLSYTASPTNGIIVSDTGTDATIPLATGVNAGLLKPSDFTQLATLDADLLGKENANQHGFLMGNLYKKIYNQKSGIDQVKWLTFGDSYAQLIYAQIAPSLLKMVGNNIAGSYFSGSYFGITGNSSTGAVTNNTNDFQSWVTGITQTFSTGASFTYGLGGAKALATKIKIYYVIEPGGGTFKVQVNGVDAVGFTNVSTAGTLGTLGVVTINQARTLSDWTVVNLTGTIKIIGTGYEDNTISGLTTINVSQGGIPLGGGLNSVTGYATALANFNQFLADVTPTVFSFEMKEDSSYYSTALNTFFTGLNSNLTNTDVLLIGSTPMASGDADQVIQNTQLESIATSFNYKYYDTYRIFKNYKCTIM